MTGTLETNLKSRDGRFLKLYANLNVTMKQYYIVTLIYCNTATRGSTDIYICTTPLGVQRTRDGVYIPFKSRTSCVITFIFTLQRPNS